MYIKSIILDGFKSYGRRMVISDFDDQFNAITGLNGTGKSNILDSICFVLGISNLGQVRSYLFIVLFWRILITNALKIHCLSFLLLSKNPLRIWKLIE